MSSDTESLAPDKTETTSPAPVEPGDAAPVAPTVQTAAPPPPLPPPGEPEQPPRSQKIALGWWIAVAVFVAGAAWASVVVARGTAFTTGQRAAAAWTGLLVVVALAVVAQVILLSYQTGIWGQKTALDNVTFRRRGLKAAIMGQDGRASTSKTQVALWTAAVVWALVDLLLLARAYPGGTLFTNAVTTNWRPEYLVLLGLPVAAATAAKAAVANANSGRGPMTSAISPDKATELNLSRVYVRARAEKKGILAGAAELFTGDDDAVAWADLQYVVFTSVTLVYFAAQFLARPADGLPPVPAALLTLMGVSATAYAANKIVNTRGVNLKSAQ